jgi:hypothetical protein
MKTLGVLVAALAAVLTGSVAHGADRVPKLQELTYTDVDQLDRS